MIAICLANPQELRLPFSSWILDRLEVNFAEDEHGRWRTVGNLGERGEGSLACIQA